MTFTNRYRPATHAHGKMVPTMAGDGEDSGLHPAHVYAFEKCGFLVTDTNRHLFDDDDLAAWDAAIAEWEPPTHHDEA